MKITNTLAIASMISLLASSAFAATEVVINDTGTTTVGTPAATIKPSKNVTLWYTPAVDGGGPTNISYSLQAGHSSGTKIFGSSSGDTKIFMKDGTAPDTIAAPAAGQTGGFGGWTAM